MKISKRLVDTVVIFINSKTFQHFTIFIIQMLEGNKALYKPCATFKGMFSEASAAFLCNSGNGQEGDFVYIRDDREGKKPFSLCEVQVFPALGETNNDDLNGINIAHEDNDDCGKPEKPVGSEVIVANGAATYKCNEGYRLLSLIHI